MSEPGRDIGKVLPEGVKVVVNRDGRLASGIVVPLAILVVAGLAIALRAAVPDWRGLAQETQARVGSFFKARKPEARPTVAAEAKPAPVEIARADPPKSPASPETPPAAWDEIRREAAQKKADQAEAGRLKAEAEAKLDETKLPPPRFRGRGRGNFNNPDAIAQVQQRHMQMLREMQARQDEMMRRMQAGVGNPDAMFGRMLEEQRRQRERFFGQMAPRMPHPMEGPQPEFFNRPRQRMPFTEERSGEQEKDGVRFRWRVRVTRTGPDDIVEP